MVPPPAAIVTRLDLIGISVAACSSTVATRDVRRSLLFVEAHDAPFVLNFLTEVKFRSRWPGSISHGTMRVGNPGRQPAGRDASIGRRVRCGGSASALAGLTMAAPGYAWASWPWTPGIRREAVDSRTVSRGSTKLHFAEVNGDHKHVENGLSVGAARVSAPLRRQSDPVHAHMV